MGAAGRGGTDADDREWKWEIYFTGAEKANDLLVVLACGSLTCMLCVYLAL